MILFLFLFPQMFQCCLRCFQNFLFFYEVGSCSLIH
ncbi:hypothetical protein SLEP1_g23977 [Rubroshorea leprosula]|uniref:Uncharacterized protein n=1 Tax=Rubroshorea leprosula TaxID=152421 RepID=A0AAV5JLE4_9ROSI|nr:hypothetical protein SLEP1_g23977 [Rubroshorea leprosula]